MIKISHETDKIIPALFSVSHDLMVIEKNTDGKFGKFVPYDELIKKVKPVLKSAGLFMIQPITAEEGENGISTVVFHKDSGQFVESWFKIVVSTAPTNSSGAAITNESQEFGKSVSYALRYALKAFFAFATGEQDYDSADYELEHNKTALQDKMLEDAMEDYQFPDLLRDTLRKYIRPFKTVEQKRNALRFIQNSISVVFQNEGEKAAIDAFEEKFKGALK